MKNGIQINTKHFQFVLLHKEFSKRNFMFIRIGKLSQCGLFRPFRIWRRDVIDGLVTRFKDAARYLQVWPVYFVLWSRDCDQCESSSVHRFPTYWHAMRSMRDYYDDWTEGPCGYWQVTRAEARQFEPHFRDHIMEAFENGNGTHVVIGGE